MSPQFFTLSKGEPNVTHFFRPEDAEFLLRKLANPPAGRWTLALNTTPESGLPKRVGCFFDTLPGGFLMHFDPGVVHGSTLQIIGVESHPQDSLNGDECLPGETDRYVGVVYQDVEGRIVAATSSAENILGLTFAQMQGRSSLDARWRTVHPDGSEWTGEHHPAMVALHTGKPVTGQRMGVFNPSDNMLRWIVVDAIPDMNSNDGYCSPRGVYTVFTETREDVEQRLAQLQYAASHDTLTGLRNRANMQENLAAAIHASRAAGSHVAVVAVDVDDFKTVNDTYGHPAGDLVLQTLAERLLERLRHDDSIVRAGGDEIIIFIPGVAETLDASRVAESVLSHVTNKPVMVDGKPLTVSLSAGVAVSDDFSSAETLLAEADRALLLSKKRGKGQVTLADSGDTDNLMVTLQDLNVALTKGKVKAFYQPVADMTTGKIVGFEALAKYRDGNGSWMDASEWLPAAFTYGMSENVDWVTLNNVLHTVGTLPEHMWIAKNVSAITLSNPTFSESVLLGLRKKNIAPHRLHLEVHETMLLKPSFETERNITALTNAGVRLWVDDFGEGYSSLTLLRKYPLYGIKLSNRCTNTLNQPETEILVQSIKQSANLFGLVCVAKGVETQNQADMLTQSGWMYGQGFLYGVAWDKPQY